MKGKAKKSEGSMTANKDEYELHFENMEAYEKGAVEAGSTLKEFLIEKVGIQKDVALELLQSYKPKLKPNEQRVNMAECVNCNAEMARGETMLSDVGLMCKECYAEREELTIVDTENKEKGQDSEEKDRKILWLFIFALSLIVYSYSEISSRGYVTLGDVFIILIACGIYVPVILQWRKMRPVFQGLFLFILCNPIIWFFWILFRGGKGKGKGKGKLIFSLNKLY